MEPIVFAAAGDIHGDHAGLIERLKAAEIRLSRPLAFILQVGDFEPVRDEKDLLSMAGPDSRRHLGSFHQVLSGAISYPAELLFIGGNHEPYGWLQTMPQGGEVAPGIHYLGRAAVVERYGLRIAALSGIHSPKRYELSIPYHWQSRKTLLKEPTYFRQSEVAWLRAEASQGPVHILMTHDWPYGHFGPFGNAPSRDLLDELQPRLHLAGHMHRPTRKLVYHPSGAETLVVGLNLVDGGPGSLLFFEWDGALLREIEVPIPH